MDSKDLELHLQQYHLESVTRAPGQLSEPYNIEEMWNHDHYNLVYPYPTCENCKISFPIPGELEKHEELEHREQRVTIPQVDGLDQEMFEFSDVPPTFRTASYSLNQSKQIDKIRGDAALNDYEVTVNNNDQNVTIKCSSGFYIQVAKASFVSIKKCSTFSTDKIGITADEVIITNDQVGLEATKLIHFSFKSEQGGEILGGVAVHLHHSSRTIQIQGSYIMPDSSRAATWFLNKVTIKRFKDIAKSKKFAVKHFNEAAKGIGKPGATSFPSSTINSCQSCFTIFHTKSKPSQCPDCQKFFHKCCLKDHNRNCKKLLPVSSLPSPSLSTPHSASGLSTQSRSSMAVQHSNSNSSHPASSPLVSSVSPSIPSSISGLQTSISFVSTGSGDSQAVATSSGVPTLQPPVLAAPSMASSPTPTPSHTSGPALPLLQLKPLHPAAVPSCRSSSTTKLPPKPATKKKQGSIPTSASDLSIEILEKELAAAQTKIVILDAQVKDKDQERAVLWARIKILEEKQNKEVLDKYFPHPEAHVSSQSSSSSRPAPPCPSTSSQSNPCSYSVPSACSGPAFLLQPPCCQPRPHHHCHMQAHSQSSTENSHQATEMEKKLESALKEIEQMKREFIEVKNLLISSKGSKPNPVPLVSDMDVAESTEDSPVNSDPTSMNASIASVEEFIVDPMSIPPGGSSAQHLNLVPTIQQ